MPDDTQDAKAQKLAAARKKLKEYQLRNNNNGGSPANTDDPVATSSNSSNNPANTANTTSTNNTPLQSRSSTVSIASNLSEPSDGETPLPVGLQLPEQPPAVSFLTQSQDLEMERGGVVQELSNGADTFNLQAFQVIIAEKAQLNAELTRARLTCRERELELEELHTLKAQAQQRLEQLQLHHSEQQQQAEQQRQASEQLQRQLQESQAQIANQNVHRNELETELGQVSQQLQVRTNELEMAQLKLRQLSDESTVSVDNRVESLVQTQYMYEQQIRDLQAMVGQLTQDKEQAAGQYQNYVQHQSGEIAKLNERNAELSEELNALRERERQLVEHVSGLERDIQKNLSLQAQFKEASQGTEPEQQQQDQQDDTQERIALKEELAALKERLSDLDFERHEFQLKIKSQDDQLQLKEAALAELEQQLEQLQAKQPDQTKLLATMESDKVAASRALSQNVEMKQQLDELQQRFVQLTNDKAELVNKLDAEEFANREVRQNFASIEEKLQANEERFKFKDEEMIRLSHENVELQRQKLMLQQQVDRLQHYEVKAYHNNEGKAGEDGGVAAVVTEGAANHEHHDHNHDHGDHAGHSHDHSHDHSHNHNHDHPHHEHPHDHADEHSCGHQGAHDHSHDYVQNHAHPGGTLPTAEAVERLQSRFTTLISKVADLTEEKHSLEHLVLQLQSETETIGEYIALYQTQRRMLKQREYEKAAQMRLLQAEREQLREKIEALNKLVASLGVELPQASVAALSEDAAVAISTVGSSRAEQVASEGQDNSQQIITKIQGIISEIKENTEQPAHHNHANHGDHLTCCLGKFEVV